MSKKVINVQVQKRALTWAMRFVKFNLIGTIVFLIGSAISTSVFPYFGVWAWFVANSTGSVLQFLLITYFNKKKKGVIFEQCPMAND
jgi:hypothetical protein